jgi:hypothetical protein
MKSLQPQSPNELASEAAAVPLQKTVMSKAPKRKKRPAKDAAAREAPPPPKLGKRLIYSPALATLLHANVGKKKAHAVCLNYLYNVIICAPKPASIPGTFREKLRLKRLEKARAAFEKIDASGDGILSRGEVVAAAAALGMTPEEAGLFFDSVDHDGSGFLDKREVEKEAASHAAKA